MSGPSRHAAQAGVEHLARQMSRQTADGHGPSGYAPVGHFGHRRITLRFQFLQREFELLDAAAQLRLQQLTMPTLVLGCTDDQMVPNAHSRHLAAEIAGAHYAELPSGHLAPMETPEALAAAIEDFLAGRTDGAVSVSTASGGLDSAQRS